MSAIERGGLAVSSRPVDLPHRSPPDGHLNAIGPRGRRGSRASLELGAGCGPGGDPKSSSGQSSFYSIFYSTG